MKKLLIISASPRKNGNSDILCDRFAEGAEENGHYLRHRRLEGRRDKKHLGL